ncbi:MAG TPA: choice-of-anchor tandem repeat GloVer-containing protein [Rhizomicrobium sp.]|nr:choice-of-anchor tandem repeat GloVer-containing protein [Rhizomicrobium sp.]
MPFVNFSTPFVPGTLAAVALVASFHGAQASRGFSVVYAFCQQAACADGSTPQGGIMADQAGNLYGTTDDGGVYGQGTVFEVAPDGAETVLYSFCPEEPHLCKDGAFPKAPLIESNGNLFGTTTSGGAKNEGTVFEISSGGTETVLYSFCSQQTCTDGAQPAAGVVMDKAGNLYGATDRGGNGNCPKGCGIVFELAPDGTETVLYSFCSEANCADGSRPRTPLELSAGNFYGTTESGGAANKGTVFEISSGGKETVLYSFCSEQSCTDGARPEAGVVMDKAGNLYGTTNAGGNANTYCRAGCGTVFELAANGGETVLHSFCAQGSCSDGAEPESGGLFDVGDGKTLYGTTEAGGANGFGTVFKLSGGTETVLYSFGDEDGAPSAGVIMMKGYLYGTTFGAFYQDDFGEVFKLGTKVSQIR